MAEPYRSSVAANATPLPGASPEDFGAAIGRGLEDAGATLHHIAERNKDLEASQAGVNFAHAQDDIDKAAIDARTNAAPGGAGHTAAVMEEFDKRASAELAAIRDKHIRAAFSNRYAELRSHVDGREYGWEAGKRVDKLATDFDDMGTTLANGQASNPDPVGLHVSLETIDTAGNALAGADAELKAKLIKEQQRKVVLGWANAKQDKDPQTLVAALDQGLLSPYLEGNDVNTLRSGGLVEIRRQEAADRAAQARAEAAARETIGLLQNKIADGYVPTDQEFDGASALARQYKLDGKEWDLGVARDQVLVNRETRTWTPAQWHSSINELEAKGDKRTAGENVRLKHLEAAAGGAISRFNSDPFAAAAAAGTPAPEVDWANPDAKAIENRVTWARSYARSAGLQTVPYLNNDELKDLRDRAANGGIAGQIEVATQVRGTFGVAAATDILRQVDPNNKDMQLMAGLQPRMAQLYKIGAEAIKGGTVKLGTTPEDKQALSDIFTEFMPAIPAELQPAVLKAAENITAGTAAEFGRKEPSGDELENTFRQAVHRAAGQMGSEAQGSATGGFVRWNGRYAWLPPAMSHDDFQRRMSRANDADWMKAGGGPPYYLGSDGKLAKMSDRQISHFGQYSLETVNPGLYQLVGPDGGHVVGKDGRPWQFDVRNLR
jgi:hypothetical protein